MIFVSKHTKCTLFYINLKQNRKLSIILLLLFENRFEMFDSFKREISNDIGNDMVSDNTVENRSKRRRTLRTTIQ